MFADDKPSDLLFDRETPGTSPYRAPSYHEWADAPIDTPAETAREDLPEQAAMPGLLELADPDADPGADPAGLDLPLPYFHTTGSQLRHRIVTAESIAELAATEKPGLWPKVLQRLLRRK